MSLFVQGSSPQSNDANLVLKDVPCDPTVQVGNVVRMEAGVAVKAKADTYANSNALGVVEKKITASLCWIRVSGVTTSIFSGLSTAEEYFLSAVTAGGISTTAPQGSGQVVLRIGQPFDSTRLFISKGVRMVRL